MTRIEQFGDGDPLLQLMSVPPSVVKLWATVNVSSMLPLPSASAEPEAPPLLSQSLVLVGAALHMMIVTPWLAVKPLPVMWTSSASLSPVHGFTEIDADDPEPDETDEQRPAACAGVPEPTRVAPAMSATAALSSDALRSR